MNGYGGGMNGGYGGGMNGGYGGGMNGYGGGMNGGNGMNFSGMNGGNGMNFNGMNGFGNGMNFGGMNFSGNGRYAGGWSGFDDGDGPPGHMRVPDWRLEIQPRFAPLFMQQARRADPLGVQILNAASERRMQKPEKKYKCPHPQCSSGYTENHNLRRHIRDVHPSWHQENGYGDDGVEEEDYDAVWPENIAWNSFQAHFKGKFKSVEQARAVWEKERIKDVDDRRVISSDEEEQPQRKKLRKESASSSEEKSSKAKKTSSSRDSSSPSMPSLALGSKTRTPSTRSTTQRTQQKEHVFSQPNYDNLGNDTDGEG